MKKYLSMISLMMVGLSIIAFTACSSGDSSDDVNLFNRDLGSVTVNGTTYSVSQFVTWSGSWSSGNGKLGVVVDYYYTKKDVAEYYYVFEYTCNHQPQVGDVYSNTNLALKPIDDSDYDIVYKDGLTYKSGSMTVVAVNRDEGRVTVKFDNLKMQDGSYNYTFNGSAVVAFEFK